MLSIIGKMENNKSEDTKSFDVSNLDVYVTLNLFMNILIEQAWQNMGLRVKPGTDKAEKDLVRAKVAIDCIEFLIGKLESQVPEQDKGKLGSLLSDLKLNFVRIQEEK